MYGITPLILIIIPLLFQIIIGRKAIGETISLKFGMVCLISLIAQIVLSILSFYIVSYNFNKYFEQNPDSSRCGIPLLGFIMLSFLFIVILIIVIIIQYFIKRSYEK
ncbi:hypothetical protein [Flavobacterium sp. FlaQc-48]|uniref:hypothetical protein n=1 Tax=Flavobacterium sp. FlaQc-48 TaxID=3374181 RepID=UPI0037582202